MLVVLAILLIVLAGMATLFVSASNSQVDQTNRVEAQRDARLALDSLRREIRCASRSHRGVDVVDHDHAPGYCQKPARDAGDVHLVHARGSRRTRSGDTRKHLLWHRHEKADSLASNAIFTCNRATSSGRDADGVVDSGTSSSGRTRTTSRR